MTKIPKPPRPPEATNVFSDGGLVPKRPVPPDIPTPPIKWIGSDDTQDDSLSFEWCIRFIAICIGIAIGLQLATIL